MKARRDLELECEKCGKRDWCEAAPVDGNGSVVETLAQNWTLLDREVQHECADSHQRTRALLGRTCGQNGQLGDLREDLEMLGTSVVEMARERQVGRDRIQNDSKSTDGRILCRPRYPKSVGLQMGLLNLRNSRQVGYNLLRIACNGGSS